MKLPADAAEPGPRRFTVSEYERMGEAGILNEDDRVELIRGEVLRMVPIGSGHSGRVARLARFLITRLGERAFVLPQGPIVLGDDSEPQPDLVVAKPRADDYTTSHPRPAEILLVIEVAETSARYDRETKAPLYAASGIPEYWIVDLCAGSVVVQRDPGPDGYRQVSSHAHQDRIAPLAFPDCILSVGDILR